jgi:hypothetical protein
LLYVVDDVEMMDTVEMSDNEDDCNEAKNLLNRATKAKKEKELFQLIKSKIDFTCFTVHTQKPEEVSESSTEQVLYNKMGEMSVKVDSNKSRQTYNYFIIGQICKRLKTKREKYYQRIEQDLGKKYSQRRCQSLVQFYELCVDYPAVKYCGVGVRNFLSHMEAIRNLIASDTDKDFWHRDF